MSVLIDPQTSAWCKELVCRIFIPADVHSILNIPLSSCLPHDTLVWAYTPKGRFKVRSAYKLVVIEFLVESTAGSSNVDTHKAFWQHTKHFGQDCGA